MEKSSERLDWVVDMKVDYFFFFFFGQRLCSYVKEILHGLNFMPSRVKHFRKNLIGVLNFGNCRTCTKAIWFLTVVVYEL